MATFDERFGAVGGPIVEIPEIEIHQTSPPKPRTSWRALTDVSTRMTSTTTPPLSGLSQATYDKRSVSSTLYSWGRCNSRSGRSTSTKSTMRPTLTGRRKRSPARQSFASGSARERREPVFPRQDIPLPHRRHERDGTHGGVTPQRPCASDDPRRRQSGHSPRLVRDREAGALA